MKSGNNTVGFGKRTKAVLAVVLVALLAIIPLLLLSQNLVPFVSVAEALESQERGAIAVKGKLVPNSYVRAPDAQTATFQLLDEAGGNGEVITVIYGGEISNLFFNDHSVFNAFGKVDQDGVLTADTLNIKCPSKYLTESERNDDGTFDTYYTATG